MICGVQKLEDEIALKLLLKMIGSNGKKEKYGKNLLKNIKKMFCYENKKNTRVGNLFSIDSKARKIVQQNGASFYC